MIESNCKFGQLLQTARIEKGLNPEDIADAIKVGKRIITYIEDENHAKLPPEVYVKGFLRVYAQVVGLDEGMVLSRYTVSRAAYVRETRRTYGWYQLCGRVRPTFLLTALLLALGLFFVINILMPFEYLSQDDHQAERIDMTGSLDNIEMEAFTVTPEEAKTSPGSKRNIRLTVYALEDSWIKIIVDNDAPKKYILKADDQIELNAFKKYNVLLSDSSHVTLDVDGKPFHIPGPSGRIVSLDIP